MKDKNMMKKKMAAMMLQKLNALDPNAIEAVTISLVLKGAPLKKKKMMEKPEEMESPEEEDDDEMEDEYEEEDEEEMD